MGALSAQRARKPIFQRFLFLKERLSVLANFKKIEAMF
jgi:hypothetical protein